MPVLKKVTTKPKRHYIDIEVDSDKFVINYSASFLCTEKQALRLKVEIAKIVKKVLSE